MLKLCSLPVAATPLNQSAAADPMATTSGGTFTEANDQAFLLVT
jgi:hypothetical protein